MPAGFRRILVAIDASPLSVAALEAAAGLAARLGAELEAVFVEDINVVRLMAHPHVHTFSRTVASRQSLDDGLIEKMLELQLVAARRAVERVAEAWSLNSSFLLRRGRVELELLAAAAACDLVCLGWSSRAAPGGKPRLGTVARAVVEGAAPSVLLSRRAAAGPVVAWWDGGECAGRALAVAAALAGPDRTIDLLVPLDDPTAAAALAAAEATAARLGILLGRPILGRAPRLLAALPAEAILVTAAPLSPDEVPCSLVVVR